MKKMNLFKAVATAVTTMSIMAASTFSTVHAAKFSMTGYTSPDALGVTLLVADADADVKNLKAENVFWIDQQNVNADGSFTIVFPEFDASMYKLYTNAKQHIFGEAKSKTVYVSSTGTGTGDAADSAASFDYAVANIDMIKEIILVDNVTYSGSTLPGDVTIKGATADVTLTLAGTVALSDTLKLDNLKLATATTFFANGYAFETTSTVTSADRLTVYGGANGKTVASTSLNLNGGLYTRVYGGGYNGTVTGDTYVVFGGNANNGDSIDDNSSSKSPCYVFGGGYNAPVNGKTNVTLDGNAVSLYLVGAGASTNGTAKDTNIFINGGKVMNVYAGSTNVALPAGTNTHITMTGGMAEALFGGCESKALTGNTYINLLGGEVTRRVYTGCYNNSEGGNNYVTGTTTLTLTPAMKNKLNTKNGLSSNNSQNVGVFAGSRFSSDYSVEYNTIIYLDDCYSSLNGVIGEQTILGSLAGLKSHADYVVKSGVGGEVKGTGVAGEIEIIPDNGKHGNVDGGAKAYFAGDKATVSGTHSVTFADDFSASKTTGGVTANATPNKDTNGTLFAAVYDSKGNYVACNKVDYVTETDTYKINIDCELASGETYTAKIFLWDSETGMSPLMNVYSITVK